MAGHLKTRGGHLLQTVISGHLINDCGCFPCVNYYHPNEWYAAFCDPYQINTGYANRAYFVPPVAGYWGTHTMNTDIAALLVNWQFAITEPSTILGNARTYRSAFISVPSLNQVIDYYYGNYTDPEVSFTAVPVTFGNCVVRFSLVDTCGVLTDVRALFYADLSAPGETTLNQRLFWSLGLYETSMQNACGDEMVRESGSCPLSAIPGRGCVPFLQDSALDPRDRLVMKPNDGSIVCA